MYDYYHFRSAMGNKAVWTGWMDQLTIAKIPDDLPFNAIRVPTMESVRQASLLELLLSAKVHVLCTGETGTGKSVSVTAALASLAAKGPTLPICLNFSAQTSANATQVILETLILFSRWRRMEKGHRRSFNLTMNLRVLHELVKTHLQS